jgi:predicted AAA+ superfamily ATPase
MNERSRAYRRRIVDDELDELLPELAAIAIEGPKGVGKTATASARAASVHALDDPAARAIAEADPARLLKSDPPILVDEWQHVPATWDLVRRAVDDGARAGTFLLTGSASPRDAGTHSGAARIPILRMRPLSLAERLGEATTVSLRALLAGDARDLAGDTDVGLEQYTEEILASGFPGLRETHGRALRMQLAAYVARVVDRDFPELGRPIRNAAALRRWMAAYAAATATTTSFEKLRDAATGGEDEKPSKNATAPYRDVLQRLWILDPVPAWRPTRSHLSRLTGAPKHHLADPALAATLLGASASALLDGRPLGPPIPRDGTLLGALFESLVTLSVRVYAQAAEASVGHLRTFAGQREVDLIVERSDGRIVAIESKLARTVEDSDTRHLKWLAHEIGDELIDTVIVTTGPHAYRRPDGVAVVPAALLGP